MPHRVHEMLRQAKPMKARTHGWFGLSFLLIFAVACAAPSYFPPGTFVLGSDKVAQAVFERNLAAMNEPSLMGMENANRAIRVSWFYPPEWNTTLRIVEMKNGELLSVFKKFSFHEEGDTFIIVRDVESKPRIGANEFSRLLSEFERWNFRSLDHRQGSLVIGGARLLVEFNDGGLYHAVRRNAPYPEDPVRRIADLAEEISGVAPIP
jgi:hypothetical protein